MQPEVWLEVSNVRFITVSESEAKLGVQIKGQLSNVERESWWPVETNIKAADYFKTVTEALDKKRRAYVRLASGKTGLTINALRLDYVT